MLRTETLPLTVCIKAGGVSREKLVKIGPVRQRSTETDIQLNCALGVRFLFYVKLQ